MQVPSHELNEQKQGVDWLTVRGKHIMQKRSYFLSLSELFELVELHKMLLPGSKSKRNAIYSVLLE